MTRWATILLAALILAGCGDSPATAGEARLGALTLRGGYAMVAPPGSGGSAYFTILNEGPAVDTIREIAVAGALATMHAMRRDGGMMRMVPALPREVAPGDSVVLAPGGTHVMFSPERPIAVGDSLAVEVEFARAGSFEVWLPVRPFGVE